MCAQDRFAPHCGMSLAIDNCGLRLSRISVCCLPQELSSRPPHSMPRSRGPTILDDTKPTNQVFVIMFNSVVHWPSPIGGLHALCICLHDPVILYFRFSIAYTALCSPFLCTINQCQSRLTTSKVMYLFLAASHQRQHHLINSLPMRQ